MSVSRSFFWSVYVFLYNFALRYKQLTTTIMKKIMALALVAMTVTLVLSSCGSSKGGNCDAYGSVDNTENTDRAQK